MYKTLHSTSFLLFHTLMDFQYFGWLLRPSNSKMSQYCGYTLLCSKSYGNNMAQAKQGLYLMT